METSQKLDRTWLCSVVFIDIVGYSIQSVESQMAVKGRFNSYVGEAIHEVPESDRVILDTGDGAAICFLGGPEAAMFAALRLLSSFARDCRDYTLGVRARIGINLGSVKLMKDVNGNLNAIGDGINTAQRIMSFAGANQILVSRSFYEVVSRLSDDYERLFRLEGSRQDKHIREHVVYDLLPPGQEGGRPAPSSIGSEAASQVPQTERAAPLPASHSQSSRRPSPLALLLAGGVLAGLGGTAFLYFANSHHQSVPVPEPSAPTAITPNPTPAKGTPQTPAAESRSAGDTRRNAKDGLEYKWIPPGRFNMGCSLGDRDCEKDERPIHAVTITRGFWIGKTEVTQAAWGLYQRGMGKADLATEATAELPVVQADWEDARTYCEWTGLRLPSEAEWEYAARATTEAPRYGPLSAIAWYGENSRKQPHPAGEKQPNAWGLLDMLGNSLEWVADFYSETYYSQKAEVNPTGPLRGVFRVLRGGAWNGNAATIRNSFRLGLSPTLRQNTFGFRCAGDFR